VLRTQYETINRLEATLGPLTSDVRNLCALALAGASAFCLAAWADAAPVKTEHVVAELVSERTALVPGKPVTLALRLKMADGWHTYWRNPGDSGLPTTLAWKLPEGVGVGAIQWPAPSLLPAGPLINFGYEGEVLLLTGLTVPRDAVAGTTLTFAARADWLVCKDVCIPEGADLDIALPVSNHSDPYPQWGSSIAAARAALPTPLQGWQVNARGDGARVALTLQPPQGAPDPGVLQFFPHDEGRIEPSGKQILTRDSTGVYTLALPAAIQMAPDFKRVDGVITAAKGFIEDGERVAAVTIDVPLVGSVSPGAKVSVTEAPLLDLAVPANTMPGSEITLVAAVFLAFIGGLILNLMPCVFPVLSLKALHLAEGHADPRTQRMQGIAFAAGVIATFVALAGLLLMFRAAGEQLGWGFQLQSPPVVIGLAVLFFVLGLNLSGVFEFASLVPSSVAGWTAKNRYVDSGLSGILAVVIASPCTAPFMGAALGAALAQSAFVTLGVFIALGAGMALPYALLAWFPGWRRLLPRPGAWMERMKQALAFPLYATVAWLVWVLGAQVDNDAVVRLLVTLVVIALALWAWRVFKVGQSRAWGAVAAAALVSAVLVVWPLLRGGDLDAPSAVTSSTSGPWHAFTGTTVSDLGSAGHPVFIDFTAAWCVTCQVNKRMVLNNAGIREAFARRGVELIRADWTRRDPVITQALAALGRQGVPVYVLYRPGTTPLLLPEILSKQVVLDALATLDTAQTITLK
jgi:thiol:disulfide interchange protein/DsbC/DsbD-like thiol-disulfide interchange protein